MSVPRFWREIPQRYNLMASRCEACVGTFFPPREVCPTCRRASIGRMARVKLAGVGAILEWTRVHKPAPGYELQVPYVVALIRTPEGPVVTGQVVDAGADGVAVGALVRAVFRRVGQDGESGVIHYGTKWVLDADARPPASATPSGEGEGRKGRKGKKKGRGKA